MTSRWRIALLIVAWYISSALAVLVLKAVFNGRFATAFGFPFAITASSNVVSGALAALVSPAGARSSKETHRYAAVIGAMTACEIGLSNAALNMLTVALATMLKGTAPLLVMAWGVALGLYRPSPRTAGVVALVSLGLVLAVDGQRGAQGAFMWTGVAMQAASGVLSGLRWVVTQLFVMGAAPPTWLGGVAQGAADRPRGAVEVVRLTAPYTAAAVTPAILAFEARGLAAWVSSASWQDRGAVLGAALGIGVCVFTLLWCEYELVRCTSSLTVSVCYVAKEVLVIGAGMLLFGDKVTALSILGFCIVQMGILFYSMQKEHMGYETLPATVQENGAVTT